jgi:hypothetical protein
MSFYPYIDQLIIPFYRLTGLTILNFYLGTFVLTIMAVVLGEFTISLYFLFNKKDIDQGTEEMISMQNLSILALKHGDKRSYKLCNKNANEAFGRIFFKQIAMASSSLWPVPFALGWMQMRFADVDLPLPFAVPAIGGTVGYTFIFIPIYILAKIIFGKIGPHLPYFSWIHRKLKGYGDASHLMG